MAVEPVKVTMRITGEEIRRREISPGSPNTMFSTPAGRPASASARPISSAIAGVSSEGLITIEQPAASAPAILRDGVIAGAFQPEKAATGPTGSGMAIWRIPPTRPGIRRP
ncbi:hypothetical protein D3C71_1257830 [compost metagenome]